MSSAIPQVRVGVGVFILENGKQGDGQNPRFLIGKRKGAHGAGTYALPGGHLEFGESFEQCAEREVKEETGLNVKNVSFLTATNDVMENDGRHYVTVFMVCERDDEANEPEVLEVDKCEGWEWCQWSKLLEMVQREEGKMFLPLVNLVRQRPGFMPSLDQVGIRR